MKMRKKNLVVVREKEIINKVLLGKINNLVMMVKKAVAKENLMVRFLKKLLFL